MNDSRELQHQTYCPKCGDAVMIITDTHTPAVEPQSWKCPHWHCGESHQGVFQGTITWIGSRMNTGMLPTYPKGN